MPANRINFSKKIVKIEQSAEVVELTFENGSQTTVDCLLGADGIHSVVRRHILGPDHPATKPVNHDGWQIYRTLVDMSVAKHEVYERWTYIVPVLTGPRGHINCCPLNKGTKLSAGVAVKGAKFTETGVAPELDPDLYKDYSKDAQAIARLVARDPSVSWTASDHDHAPTYLRGRVAMMGDAAHAMLPFSVSQSTAIIAFALSSAKQANVCILW